MNTPDQVLEIFLQPGELYFGDQDTRIRTVLGSCVSLTFWHPGRQIGGMCHYMLPSRTQERRSREVAVSPLDGRYADEAMELLAKEMDAAGAPHQEYEVKLFGGGNMFPGRSNQENHVGLKNVETARNIVARHGFNCVAEHLGGVGHRNVIFDVWSGRVWVKYAPIGQVQAPAEVQAKNRAFNMPGLFAEKRMACAAFA